MQLLENYPTVRLLLEAVGLSVFHTLWAGGLLLLLLIVVLKAIPAQRPRARFTVAFLTLQLLFLLFSGTFFYHWNQLASASDPTVTITAPTPTPTIAAPPALVVAIETNAPATATNWSTLLHRWSPWWAALWLLGGVFHAIQLLRGLQHTRRLSAGAQPVSGDWENLFVRLQERLGIKRPVKFRESDRTNVPLTFGWLKPVVLTPVGLLTQLSLEQVEMIVLHELAHIRRHDYLGSLLQSVAEVLLFYHPAYWYIARVLEREREFACDQMTINVTQQPETYARTLLQVATTAAPSYGLAASGKRGLSARIKRIMAPASGQRGVQILPALILIGVLGLASVTLVKKKKTERMLDRIEQKLPTGEDLQTQPAPDSTAENTLIIIDGVPQYGKTWDEVDKLLKQNPRYAHYTLTSYGPDLSQTILRELQTDAYDKVVRIDSWGSLKKDGKIAPKRLEGLLQVFPNPTQDWFTLQFQIGEELPVTITVLNDQGQLLTTLTDQTYPAGFHETNWDASGRNPGVYFVQWAVGEQRVTRRVVIE